MTIDERKASILEMARGAILERVDYEMGKVLQNIFDPNTNPTKVRKITVDLTFAPSSDRTFIQVGAVARSKLEPTTMIQTSLAIHIGMNGIPEITENSSQLEGQMDLYGGEEPPAKILAYKRAE